jgi:hypothetical protein
MVSLLLIGCRQDPGSGAGANGSSPLEDTDGVLGDATPAEACVVGSLCTYWSPDPDAVSGRAEIVDQNVGNIRDGATLGSSYVFHVDVGIIDEELIVTSAASQLAVITGSDSVTRVGAAHLGADVELPLPIVGSRYDAVKFGDAILFLTPELQRLRLDNFDLSVVAPVVAAGTSDAVLEGCAGGSPTEVHALAADGTGQVYYRNGLGIYRLDADMSAELVAPVCLPGGGRFAMAADGLVAYVIDGLRVLRVDIVSGAIGSIATVDCSLCFAIHDLAVHPATGDLYVADGRPCVYRYTRAGESALYAGTCDAYGSDGDGLSPTDGLFTSVSSVAIDASGDVFLADMGVGVVRVALSEESLVLP